jgi:hypothetical protein
LPLAGRAQQTSGPRKVGVLFPGTLGADRERLINEGLTNELGSEKAVLLARSSAGDDKLLDKYAAELAAEADVVLAIGSVSFLAARQATPAIPSLHSISKPIQSRSEQRRASTGPAAM